MHSIEHIIYKSSSQKVWTNTTMKQNVSLMN